MDPRCKPGILIGFDKEMSSYRIWDTESQKVVCSRDVLFSRKEEEMGKVFTEETTPQEEEVKQEPGMGTTINEGGDKSNIEIIDSCSAIKGTRKSSREKKPVERYGNWTTYLAVKKEMEEISGEAMELEVKALQTFVKENAIIPNSFRIAKQLKEWPMWRKAVFTELDSIIKNGVFEIVPKGNQDINKTLINTQWVLNKKFDTEENLKRYKARCVARGFKQKEGIEFEETFSPTGRLSTMQYILNYATQKNIKPRQAEFVTAYLNSKLEEDKAIYNSIPKSFVEWISKTKQEAYNLELARELT
jgi:hypothetical protein